MRFGVAEIERVDHHADIRRVFARLPHMRNLDQLEGCLMHRRLEFLVTRPVAISLLDHDTALEQQTLQHFLDVELRIFGIAHAEGNVLEIAEQRHVGYFRVASHKGSMVKMNEVASFARIGRSGRCLSVRPGA